MSQHGALKSSLQYTQVIGRCSFSQYLEQPTCTNSPVHVYWRLWSGPADHCYPVPGSDGRLDPHDPHKMPPAVAAVDAQDKHFEGVNR
jgi:hypothetical protein